MRCLQRPRCVNYVCFRVQEPCWQVQLDDAGSAIVHESNMQVMRPSEGPVDQRTKDERTAMRRAKVQERRSQRLGL